MKKGLRCFSSFLLSLFIALAPNIAMANDATIDDECAAGGVRYFDCQKKCDGNRSCDENRAGSVGLVGDSITADGQTKNLLLGGIDGLDEEHYDARSSRPWAEGLSILKDKMLSQDIIVYELGTNNASFSKDNIKEVMDIVGNSKTVIFVTNYASNSNYPWFEDHNTLFHEAENEYNNVRVVDWAQTAADNGYMLDDPNINGGLGVHPYTQEEHEAFANLIIDAVAKGVCRTGAAELLGDNAEEMIWSGLLSVGFTKEQAAGIMGSMWGESGFNPAKHENSMYNSHWNGGAFKLYENAGTSYGLGLIQWSFQRRINVYNYVKEKAPDLIKYLEEPETYSYGVSADEFLSKAGEDGVELMAFELQFLYDEVSSTSSYQGILNKTTVSEASEFFVRHIEIPGNMEQAVRDRDSKAHEYYDKYKDRSDLEPSNYSGNIAKATDFVLADVIVQGKNKDYNGDPVFTDDQMAKIEEYAPFYKQAVEGTEIPWEMAAAIHTRESGLSRTNPCVNNDGLFQFYQSNKYPACQYVDDEEFVDQLHTMVEVHLLPKWKDGLSLDDQVKQIFFGYNGRAGVYIQQARDLGFTEEQAQLGEGSPYVMNKADAKRDPNKAAPGTWGQIKTDGGPIVYPANQDHGAYVMYLALHGGSMGDGACGGRNINNTSGNKISDTAMELAWPIGDEHNSKTPNHGDTLVAKPEYETAAKSINNFYTPGGADCSYFVGTVVVTSGADPSFPKAGSAVQTDYLQKSDKWENLTSQNNGTDESFLKPGDVLIVPNNGRPGHVRVIVDLGDGTLGTAEASLNSHSGEVHSYIGLDAGLNRGLYQVYRLKE